MKRFLPVAAVALVATTLSAQAPATMLRVGATVAPRCTIAVSGVSVAASCGADGLRVLRVTTSTGDSLVPSRTGRQLRAGGDAFFVVQPRAARETDPAGRTILVSLDF